MESAWGKPKKKEPITKYARHMGIGAILAGAVVLLVIIAILWWFYGYYFVVAPLPELSFTAANSTIVR
jgi:hypothetical protein